jgi:hypothetical protein
MEIPLIVTKHSSSSSTSTQPIVHSNVRTIAPKTATSRSQITTKPITSASLKRSQEVTSNASSVVIDEQVSKIAKLFNDKHVECCKLTYDLNQ